MLLTHREKNEIWKEYISTTFPIGQLFTTLNAFIVVWENNSPH